jgi:hypothetical protein
MDERLLRHELGHEADRRNPKMLYDSAIHERWKDNCWALDIAANISLDSRLGKFGLGLRRRRKEFLDALGEKHISVFRTSWSAPPQTWPEIEALAQHLLALRRTDSDKST